MKRKLMVCVDLSNESVELFKNSMGKWNWESIDEVHFVHGFQLQTYADLFFLSTYPSEEQYDDVEESVNSILKGLEEHVVSMDSKVRILRKCIITNSPKEALVDYVERNKIDTMAIGTRGKHGVAGLFPSSFAEYMVKHAPCELKIIRAN